MMHKHLFLYIWHIFLLILHLFLLNLHFSVIFTLSLYKLHSFLTLFFVQYTLCCVRFLKKVLLCSPYEVWNYISRSNLEYRCILILPLIWYCQISMKAFELDSDWLLQYLLKLRKLRNFVYELLWLYAIQCSF